MAITTAQFAADYAALLEAQGVVLEDRPLFVVTFAGQLTDWLGGGDAIPAELAYRLKQTLGYWNAFSSGMVGFLTIDAEGGPNGDGTVTIVDGLGVTHTIDSLARLVLQMAGIVIKGTLPSVGDLPAAGDSVGEIYLIAGVGYVWTGAAWTDIGPIRGPKGDAATLAVGTVETVEPGAPAAVVNSGTAGAAVFNFEIPQGVPGLAATVSIGEVNKVGPDVPARVENAGTSQAAVLDFDIPEGDKGDAATIAVGDVTTLAPGQAATVTNVGSDGDAVLDFGIPQGIPGVAATIEVGEVTTAGAGQPAAVANSGTAAAAVFDFVVPQGVKGDKGERGDPFEVNVVGLFSERSAHDAAPIPFAFLASDLALVFFRQAGGWSEGVRFGVDPEDFATKVFAKRAAKKAALIYG